MQVNATPNLAGRFALIVKGLRDVLAAHMVRADRTRPLLILLWKRLGQLDRRIAILSARFAAGRRVAPRNRPQPRPPAEAATRTRTGDPSLRLPTRPGWLVAEAQHTSTYGNYFRLLLEDPEMIALLDAAPQLKRQLRAVLRALMSELPPSLALPPRQRPAKPPRAPRPRQPRKPRRAPCHGAFRPKEFWRPGPIRPIWTA